jgi:hypothetical protein
MLKFTDITMKNFLSVGGVTQGIRLDQGGMTLVLGMNADSQMANSRNGVGKTTILQALSYALYGQPLTRIRLDNLVNNVNTKAMWVSVGFQKDGRTYRIERGRKPNVLKFTVDNVENTEPAEDETQGENKHTQTEIERVLGMTHMMFRHIVALNTFTDPFLRLKAAEQREVIEELLGVTLISERAETLKRVVAKTKEDIRVEEARVKAATDANARIEIAIRRAEDEARTWTAGHERRLGLLATQLENLTGIDFDSEIAAFDALDVWRAEEKALKDARQGATKEADAFRREAQRVEGEAKRLNREAGSDDIARAQRLDAEAQRLLAEAGAPSKGQEARLGAEASRREAEATRAAEQAAADAQTKDEVEVALANPDSHHCSTCGQGLAGTDHIAQVQKKLADQIAKLDASITRNEELATRLLSEAKGIRLEIATAQTEDVGRRQVLREQAEGRTSEAATARLAAEDSRKAQAQRVAEVLAAVEGLLQQAAEKDSEAAEIGAAIVEIGAPPITGFPSRDDVWKARQTHDNLIRDIEQEAAKRNPHDDQIDALRATIAEPDYGPLNDHILTQKHQDFLLKMLTSKDSFVRKKIVDQNLSYLNGRLNHYLGQLALPHEVKFMPDLTVEIALLGRDFDFEQLSRGEQNRLILATSWSFRDVWENMNTTVNLMIADEVLDSGIDEAGGEAALEVLNQMARDRMRDVFLVTHKEGLIGKASRILTVRKEDGFTCFEDEVRESLAA